MGEQTASNRPALSGTALALVAVLGASYAAYQHYIAVVAVDEATEVATITAPVIPSPLPSTPDPSPAAAPAPAVPARIPTSRSGLAQALQTELKRTGCYDGPLTGTWNTATRQAMRTFAENVNARLPVQEPDQILLALVQGHREQVCIGDTPENSVAALPPPNADSEQSSQQSTSAESAAAGLATAMTGVGATVAAQEDGSPLRTPLVAPVTDEPPKQAGNSPKRSKVTQSRSKRASKKSSYKSVSKSINKSFKSLQRSLAAIFQ